MRMSNNKPPLPPGVTREEIGARLRATREALGLSSTVVCEILDIRRSTWSMNEYGKSLPNVFDMIRFSERFGVTLDWIYRGDRSGLRHDLAARLPDGL